MKRFLTFSFFLLTLNLPADAQPADKFFPIGVWYEGAVGAARHNLIPEDPQQAAKMYDRDFAEIAAHGINIAVIPNTPPAHHKLLLDAAANHGLKLIIELGYDGDPLGPMVRGKDLLDDAAIKQALRERLGPVKDHPALLRVQILDEPGPQSFDRYAHINQLLAAYAPRTPGFCCLAGTGQVEKFLDVVKPDVIAFDLYPYGTKTQQGDLAPLRAFEAGAWKTASAAASRSADSWAVIQTHSITGIHRFPTPAEIRCMTHLSLATGNRGVFYFLYQTEYWNKEKNEMMAGLVNADFKGDARWEEIAVLAKTIKQLAPVLSALNPDKEQPERREKAAVYLLRDQSQKAYYYAVNLDVEHPQRLALRGTSRDAAAVVTLLPDEAHFDPARDGQDVLWEVELAPGAGALYRID